MEDGHGAPARLRKEPADPRKHHYVPVFYQKNFTNERELLWVYDRQRHTYKELHPLSVCFEKDFYAVKPEGKPRDMQVETKVLKVIDDLGCRGIRDFLVGKPNQSAEHAIAIFMAFQWQRVPTMSRDIRTTYAKLIEEVNRITFANVERAKAVMERYERETGATLKVTPESMVEAIQGKHIEIVATETAFLTTMMEQAKSLARNLLQLDWEILEASDETGFVICDCPVVVVPPKDSKQIGFLVAGSAKYMALSKRMCLRLGEPGSSRKQRKVDKDEVRLINQNIAANSERFIMGPSRDQLENIVSRSGCTNIESTPRLKVETLQSDDNNALQALVAQPRRYFYRSDAVCAP